MSKENSRMVGRYYRHSDAVLRQHVREINNKRSIKDCKLVNGVVTEVERVKPINDGLKYTDFSIGCLIESGNVDLLKRVAPIASSPLYDSDSIADNLSNLEN